MKVKAREKRRRESIQEIGTIEAVAAKPIDEIPTWISVGGGLLWASTAEKIAQILFPSSAS